MQWTGIGTVGDMKTIFIEVDTIIRTKNKDVPCRPDIVIRDHTRKTITIVDVAVAWEPLTPEAG